MNAPILLCIATGQNLANLIPALQVRPAEAWILATPAMRAQAQALKKILKRHDIASRIEAFDDSNLATLEAEALRIAEQLDGKEVVFNTTGGTKQMALILSDTLQVLGAEAVGLLYADTSHQRIDWLRPRGRGCEAMQDLVSLEDILGAQGFRLGEVKSRDEAWIKTVETRGLLTKDLGDKADRLRGFFGALNMLAQRATHNGQFTPRQDLDYAPARPFAELLKKSSSHDLLTWDGDTGIEFADLESARYFGGGWLEEYVFHKLRGCHVRDYAVSATIIADDGTTTNEIDALAVHRNRLLAIECKTLRFGRDGAKDADIMYKLDSLARRAGGIMHQRMLLSARPLDEHNAARAAELDIAVVAGKDVRSFPDRIRRWMAA